MSKLIFPTALLIGLFSMPAPVLAQSVSLQVCNTGKVDIDVFISAGEAPFSSHIKPANCEMVAESGGAAEAAYIGVAFTDARGEWGAPRRFNGVPYMGVKTLPLISRLAIYATGEKQPDPLPVLSLAAQNFTVRHGNKDVSLPLQLLFQPRLPDCHTVGGTSAESNLPLNASAADRAWARSYDAGGVSDAQTTCEELRYTLMVEAYPDSREARLDSLPLSGLVMIGSTVHFSVEENEINWAEEESDRKQREEPEGVKWDDLLAALRRTYYGGPNLFDVLPRYFVIRGTVASVEVRDYPTGPDTTIPVAEIVFKESPFVTPRPDWEPYSEFNACTEHLDILQEHFGEDFATSMVGKTIEVRGSPGGSLCRGRIGAFQISLARQIKAVKSTEFAAGTRVWVPPPVEEKPAAPPMTVEQVAASIADGAQQQRYQQVTEKQAQLRRICVDQSAKFLEEHPGDYINNQKEYSACLNAAARYPETGPPPAATVLPALAAQDIQAAMEAHNKAIREQYEQAAQERMAAQERAIEKAKPCAQELLTAYPDWGRSDPTGYRDAFYACVEAQREPLPPAAIESAPKYKPKPKPKISQK